jgi:hypothetical protein
MWAMFSRFFLYMATVDALPPRRLAVLQELLLFAAAANACDVAK